MESRPEGVFFFKKLKKFVSRFAKPVTRILPKPVRAVATGLTKLQPKTLFEYARQGPVLGPVNFAAKHGAPKIAPYVQLGSTVAAAFVPGGQAKMAFNLGGFVSQVGQILGGSSNPNLRAVGTVASLGSNFIPQRSATTGVPRSVSPITRTAAMTPAIRGVTAVGRSFFQKFPNLATAMNAYRMQGKKVTRSKLYGLVRRFGPEIVISGGLLSAAAVNELMIAGPGRRRMNPANVKALRRSMRRLESFHRLCSTSDMLRSKRRKVCK